MFVWTISDLAGLAALAIWILLVVALTAWLTFKEWRRQRKCQHPRVTETRSCDAICISCGKNLGFIGAWRERQKGGG